MINKTLQKIFLDSLTLREREKEINKIISVYEDPGFATKISQWKNNVGESSPEFFNKRLEWPNISRDSLEKLLNPIKEFDFNEFEFPLWICDLDDFLESVNPQNTLLKTVDIPFSDILSVLVEYFCTRICSLPRGISSGAFFDLKISLLRQLSKLASQSLLEYMNISDLSYQKFVKKLSTGGFVDFFSLYPYLARLLFVQGRFWIDNTSSTFSFFNEDYLDLCAKLKAKEVTVVHIHSDISESHNYGKNVAIFETKTAKFVFKYRDVRTEGRFFQFLDFLNSSLNIKQYVPWVIERDDHGWMEYISHSPCTSAFEIQEYYKKCGYFLALFHLLGSTDLHSENIIASGSYPVFIDLETLVSPLPNLNNPYINKLNEYIDFQYGLSVSRSGILPQWLLGPDTNVYNNSALGGRKSKVLYSKITWKNINKDDMGFEYAEQEAPEDANVVYLGKEIQNPYDYVDNILEGYSTFCDYLLSIKGDPSFLSELRSFQNMRVRFVFRATKVYTLLLDYLNHPDFMVDGINRSLEMEVLAKGLLVDISKKYIFWDVLNDELAQLESNDIPYYFTNTSDISLQSNRGLLYDSAFQYSGESKIFSTLTELNPEIVEFQSKIILNSVSTDILDLYGKTFTPYDPNSKFCISDKDKIEKILVDIFQRITDSMIEVDSRITWVGYVSNVVSHTYGYKPVGLDIANGNMGVAIFLCALYAYTGDRKYIEKLDFIVAPIIDVLSQEWSRKEFLDRFGTGITTGIGSIIYGFLKIYEYSGDNKYLEHALSFVSIIKTTDIEKSIRQDVVSGNAGLLLALSKLHEFYESSDFDILVERCLDTIVQTGFQDNRFVNWDYQQNKKLVGFSHGSSGILYALSKFSHHLSSFGNPLKIFENIIDYEYGFYDAKQNNWYDLRFDIPELDVVSWCHGALGVGMSRLNFFKSGVSIDNKVPRDIKNSLDKTVETGGHFLDTLCCGNSGRIDFFLELQNTSFYEEAADKYLHWLVNNMISNYESSGDFTYFSKFKTSDINVGFFQGLSGIGYELLRFLDPKKFSSILLFK